MGGLPRVYRVSQSDIPRFRILPSVLFLYRIPVQMETDYLNPGESASPAVFLVTPWQESWVTPAGGSALLRSGSYADAEANVSWFPP